ncbi:hypothetical protein ABPG73_015501 [Tetrahymena malaccensis]
MSQKKVERLCQLFSITILILRVKADCNDPTFIQQTGYKSTIILLFFILQFSIFHQLQDYDCILQSGKTFTEAQAIAFGFDAETALGLPMVKYNYNCNPDLVSVGHTVSLGALFGNKIHLYLKSQQQIQDLTISYDFFYSDLPWQINYNELTLTYGTKYITKYPPKNVYTQLAGCLVQKFSFNYEFTGLSSEKFQYFDFQMFSNSNQVFCFQGINNVVVYVNYQCPLNCSSCDSNQNCLTCLDGYYIATNPNTNLAYCKLTCAPQQYATLPDSITQSQTCQNCINNCSLCSADKQCDNCNSNYEFISQIAQCLPTCNSNQYRDSNFQCQNCMTNCLKCTGPSNCSNCQSPFQFDNTLHGVLNYSTEYLKIKQIVISSIQSQYPPIYRYYELSIIYSFYVQTCDQNGPFTFMEPLSIQIQSSAMPSLNYSNSTFKDAQIEIVVKPYTIPIGSSLDLNVLATLISNQDISQTNAIQIQPKLTNLLILIEGGSNQLVNYKVFPIIQTNQVDEVQIQQYHSITQQTPQLQPVAQQQIPQQIQQINEIDEIQQRNDLKSISSKRSISFAAFEKQKDSLKLVSNQGFKDRKMSQFSNNIIENNELKVENFSAEDSKQQNFDIQKDIGELNLDQQQTNQIQSERKCVSLTNIRQNNIPNKEIPTKITTNISNEKIISHDEENKQDNQKSALDNDQEQQEFQHKKELEQKKQQEDNLVIEKYMSYPTLIRVLAFHDFFSIYFLYDKVLSRSIRFTIYYIRVIHCLSISTIFGQQYNEAEMIMVSIINSVVLQVSVGIITLTHKIKRIGKYISTFCMIVLCLFYYYLILAVVSGQSAPSSNSKIISFFIMVGIDFAVVSFVVSIIKMKMVSHMLNKEKRIKIIKSLTTAFVQDELRIGFKNFGKFKKYDNSDSPLLLANGEKLDSEEIRFMDEVKFYCVDFAFNYDCIIQSGISFTESQAEAFGFDVNTALGNPIVKHKDDCSPDLVAVGHTLEWGSNKKIHLNLKSQQQIQDLTITYDFFYSDKPSKINYNLLTFSYGTQDISKKPSRHDYTKLIGCDVYKFSINYEFTGLSSEDFLNFNFKMFSDTDELLCFQGVNNVVVYVNYQCPLNCSSCDSNQNCLTCLDNYYVATNPSTNLAYCKLICPPQQYATLPDSITQSQTCQNCIYNCQQCIADKQCNNCISDYEFVQEITQCLPTCKPNQYRDSNYQCQDCIANCLKCSGPDSCSNCLSPFQFDNTLLQCICLTHGFYLDQNGSDSIIIENDQLSLIPGFLSYEVSPSIFIETFYLLNVAQLRNLPPQINVKYDKVQNTCNDITYSLILKNDANRGFLQLQWSVQVVPSLDSQTQSQVDSIIQAANTNMSQSLTINKYILPPNSQINVQFTYMLKINSSGVLNYSTEYIKNKQIVISSIQSEYQPIYRYYELSFDYSFYIQTCDQNGLLIFMEPLSIQIQSSAMPSLNYNNSTFQDAHIQVVVKPYTIQIGSSLDLNVLATLVSNQDISQTNSIQIIPKLVNLLILIEGGSNQLFYNASSRVFPIIITNQVEKVQNQQYHSVTQQTPQILPQTEYQITQQEQKLNKLDGMLQRNNSKSISSKRSISFTAFEAQKDCLKLASNQGFIDRKMSQFSHNIIENNELKGLNLNNEDCKQQNLDIQKDIEELNLDQQQIDLKQIEKKCVSLSNFRQNDIPNKEIPTKITTNISNEKIISHDEENKQDNQKSALDNDQEQQEFQHKKELEQKKQQEDNLVIEKYMSYPTLIRVLVFHDFFSIYFLYDKVLSRSIRFTIYYIRVIHCLSISTIFGQQYNEAEMIMVSIINSVVLQVSVGIITLTHKIKRIGKYISTFCMIVLCLFYYYLILAVVSGQSAPSSNSKVASFFIMVGIDFAVKSEQNQQQNYFTC